MKSRQRQTKIPVSQIRKLSRLQLTTHEAAAFFGVTESAFLEMLRVDVAAKAAWDDGRALGKLSIRRKQFKLADKNPSMAIWLGRQYLGQHEVSTIEHSGPNGGPIKTLDLNKLDRSQRHLLRDILLQARGKKSGDGTPR